MEPYKLHVTTQTQKGSHMKRQETQEWEHYETLRILHCFPFLLCTLSELSCRFFTVSCILNELVLKIMTFFILFLNAKNRCQNGQES